MDSDRKHEKKRQKSQNFSPNEVTKLVALVKKHQHRVNFNKTDSNKNEIRKDTWEKIATEFNTSNESIYRSGKNLKTKYKNIKKKICKKNFDMKAHPRGTGGSNPNDFNITLLDQTIQQTHGSQIDGFTSIFKRDCDEDSPPASPSPTVFSMIEVNLKDDINSDIEVFNEEAEANGIFENVDVKAPKTHVEQETSLSVLNSEKYTPAKLKLPTASPWKCSQKNETKVSTKDEPLKCKIGQWADTKKELVDLQKKAFIQEHELKMKKINEKYDKEMYFMEEEFKQKQKFNAEYQKLKIEVLIQKSQKNNLPKS